VIGNVEYEFKYYSANGEYLFSLTDNHYGAEFWVAEAEVGSLIIDLPIAVGNEIVDYLELDATVEIYRSYNNVKTLMFGKRWFLVLWREKEDNYGQKSMRLLFYCCNNLIERRIVNYPAGSNKCKIDNEHADDAIKRILKQNMGNLAPARRDWSAYIDIEDNFSLAPKISIEEFAHVKTSTVLENICTASMAQNNTYLTYNVGWQPETQKYVIATYVGHLGADRGIKGQNTLYFTVADDETLGFGGLGYASVAMDGTSRRTAIYCGGRDEGEKRIIVEVFDDDAISQSPFGLWESWQDARNLQTEDGVRKKALEVLNDRKAKFAINGHMSGSFTKYFGAEFGWGDVVAFKFKNYLYDIHINKVHFQINDNGSEDIKIYTRNLEDSYY